MRVSLCEVGAVILLDRDALTSMVGQLAASNHRGVPPPVLHACGPMFVYPVKTAMRGACCEGFVVINPDVLPVPSQITKRARHHQGRRKEGKRVIECTAFFHLSCCCFSARFFLRVLSRVHPLCIERARERDITGAPPNDRAIVPCAFPHPRSAPLRTAPHRRPNTPFSFWYVSRRQELRRWHRVTLPIPDVIPSTVCVAVCLSLPLPPPPSFPGRAAGMCCRCGYSEGSARSWSS